HFIKAADYTEFEAQFKSLLLALIYEWKNALAAKKDDSIDSVRNNWKQLYDDANRNEKSVDDIVNKIKELSKGSSVSSSADGDPFLVAVTKLANTISKDLESRSSSILLCYCPLTASCVTVLQQRPLRASSNSILCYCPPASSKSVLQQRPVLPSSNSVLQVTVFQQRPGLRSSEITLQKLQKET
ncbi:hypothetical protein HDU79_001132, partial [Rhizoclosmatium sp. JEL0117]